MPSPADESPPIEFGGAMRSLPAHLRLWLLAIIGLIADLWSKEWAFDTLAPNEKHKCIPGVLDLQLSLNSGALFGMGSGMVWLFISASIVALGFVVYLFASSHPKQRAIHLALGMILAGALGNLHDRVIHQYDMVTLKATDTAPKISVLGTYIPGGSEDVVRIRPWWMTGGDRAFSRSSVEGEVKRVGVVRDFLKITPQIGGKDIWKWVFNVADVLLVIGVLLLLLSFWFQRPLPAVGEFDSPTDA